MTAHSALVDFLLARIADDEKWAEVRDRATQVVADCGSPANESEAASASLTLRLLAHPYSGHPDYRPEWRL